MRKPKKKVSKPRKKKACAHPKATLYCVAKNLGIAYTSANYFYEEKNKGFSGRRCKMGKASSKALDLNQVVELSKYVRKPMTKSQALRMILERCL